MARKKSALRRAFNLRTVRWQLQLNTIGRSKILSRMLAFYPQPIAPEAAFDTIIEEHEQSAPTGFDAAQRHFVNTTCRLFDSAPDNWTGTDDFQTTYLTAIIEDCDFLGHTGTVLAKRHGTIVMARGVTSFNFSKAAILRRLPPLEGKCLLLMPCSNYYHALLDGVWLALEARRVCGEPVTIVVPARGAGMVAPWCALLAKLDPLMKVCILPVDGVVHAPEAIWIRRAMPNREWAFPDAAPIRELAEIFRAAYAIAPSSGRRIFFSRGNAKIRRLKNEAAIWAIAQAHGFERFEARGDDHAAQVRAFSQASIIIGVHGAGLANLIFCHSGTRVLEIFPANFIKSTYVWICQRMALLHHHIIGTAGNYDQGFELDAAEFEKTLAGLLNEGASGAGAP